MLTDVLLVFLPIAIALDALATASYRPCRRIDVQSVRQQLATREPYKHKCPHYGGITWNAREVELDFPVRLALSRLDHIHHVETNAFALHIKVIGRFRQYIAYALQLELGLRPGHPEAGKCLRMLVDLLLKSIQLGEVGT